MGADLAGMVGHEPLALFFVGGLYSVEIGFEGCLGVDDDRPAFREANDRIGPELVSFADALLLDEIDMFGHPCEFEYVPQLVLSPLATGCRPP